MKITNKFLSVLLSISLLISSCAHVSAPIGWLSEPNEMKEDAFGGWITIKFNGSETKRIVEGELIAVTEESVYVASNTGISRIDIELIESARLVAYDSNAHLYGVGVLLGIISTLSHGFFLVLSVPIWILAGSLIARGHSKKPILEFPQNKWNELNVYARFPQGLPPSMDLQKLEMKKTHLSDSLIEASEESELNAED